MAGWRERFDGVRWVRPEGIHLSVHFFGRLDDADVATALAAVAPAAAARSPFVLRLGGLGCFPERGPVRVLWVGVDRGAEQLAELARGCRSRLAAAGFAVETGPFRAHCTVGRTRTPWRAAERAGWLTSPALELPEFDARVLTLYESQPGRGGSVYTPRAQLTLAGR